MEHHSNIVPWQLLCEQTGARLRVLPVTDAGELDASGLSSSITARTKIVSLVHVSNAIGTINPVKAVAEAAHAHGALVLLDGAQAAPHLRIDVQDLACDFYAFSSHKMFGPTGIGVLYGRLPLLEEAPPWQGGGDMISAVSFERTTFNAVPHKFEAGTPHIAGAAGLRAAVEYIERLDRPALEAHERDLLEYATARALEVPGVRIIGAAPHKVGVLSFVVDDVHPHDVGTILDREGVAVRTGHHCCMPLMDRFGVPGTTRASFALYNTRADVDALADGLRRVREMFR
jgi:cysteine desulfurase/selenocysteine lyase